VASYVLDPCVEEELWDIWAYIAKHNPDAATRVIEAVRETFSALAENPGLGSSRTFRNPRVRDIYCRPVSGFDRYLVFYRKLPGGIQVVHVFHVARKIERLFKKR